MIVRPLRGPQTTFARSSADIAIFGGAAGPGKSWCLVYEPTRWVQHSDFRAAIFRRTNPELIGARSVWEYASDLYRPLGASLREQPRDATFPSGATVEFHHLQFEKDIHGYQSKAWELLAFDELVHFTERQFWYMQSRNRSTSGRRPYTRGATNPDAESWVRPFIDWWIGEDGFPISERSGRVRWCARVDEQFVWENSKAELLAELELREPNPLLRPPPLSVTFVNAKLEDNPILMEKDPGYLAKLAMMPLVDRLRLRSGNWNVKACAGLFFKESWLPVIEACPADVPVWVRAWDLAGTDKTADNSPAWTVGAKMGKTAGGAIIVKDIERFQGSPLKVEQALVRTAKADGQACGIAVWRDPGQSGKAQESHLARLLLGYNVHFEPAVEDKITYAKPLSAQAEAGNVSLVRGQWVQEYVDELKGFPDLRLKDQVDASSLGFKWLAERGRVLAAQST